MNEAVNKAHTKLTRVRNITNDILSYLIKNNEELWKLLYYEGDTINEPNLTKDQKNALVAVREGSLNPENHKVFLNRYSSNITITGDTQLRIQPVQILPDNHMEAIVTVLFQCIVKNTDYTIQTDRTRTDNRALAMAQSIIETLNGESMPSYSGELFFNQRISPSCSIVATDFGDEFSGFEVMMSMWLVD